jgi:16S rRNA (cytosine967-C5)-methyltransferase
MNNKQLQIISTLSNPFHTLVSELKLLIESDQNLSQKMSLFLKKNPKLGSRDRKWLNQTIFCFFRFFSILKNKPINEVLLICVIVEKTIHATEINNLNSLLHEPLTQTQCEICEKYLISDQSFIQFFNSLFSMNIAEKDFYPQAASPYLDAIFLKEHISQLQAKPFIFLALYKDKKIIVDQFIKEGKLLAEDILDIPEYNAIALQKNINFEQSLNWQKGFIEPQDLASQIIAQGCLAKSNESWWDCCSGAGGKALRLAYLMVNKGQILCTDNRDYKFKESQERAKRLNISILNYKKFDFLTDDLPENKLFDGVLIDAPCSGSGTWSRNVFEKWQFTESKLNTFLNLQKIILYKAALHIKKNGTLVYATCSIFACENQDQVNEFLKTHPDFIQEESRQINPLENKCDSMYYARLKRI